MINVEQKYATYLLILLLMLGSYSLSKAQIKLPFAHKIEVDVLDTRLDKQDTSIVIQYHLKGSRKRFYKVQLYYSNNGGNSFKGPLRSLKGDIGDSTKAGKDKTVSWSFRKDNPYFNGERTMFRIDAAEIPKISTGGPENALRSLLVPGLGDTKVRNGYNYGWITALTYVNLGMGTFLHFHAQNKFKDYESRIASTEEEHQALYNQARNRQNLSRGFLIAGGVIWLADVIGVYARGVKNKRRIAAAEAQEEEEATSYLPIILPSVEQGRGQLSLLWRF